MIRAAHNFQPRPRDYVAVYHRGLPPVVDVTIAGRDSGELVLNLKRGDDVSSYLPWESLPQGFSATDFVLAWIDPVKRGELAERTKLRFDWFIEPGRAEMETAERFMSQRRPG